MTSRRSFLKTGAIIAAPLAGVAAPALALANDGAHARLARLEDERAIGDLHQALIRRINSSGVEQTAEFFADGRAPQLDQGLCALVPDHAAQPVALDLAQDGKRASGRYACYAEVEHVLEGHSTLEQMARIQGGGSVRRSESRVLVADYVKQGDGWAVERLGFA